MFAENARNAERWTASRPADETEPKGRPECARNALAYLGPFKQKFKADAQRVGPWATIGIREPISEELACERILMLAVSFNEQELLSEDAPRIKHVVEKLKQLETLAGELSRFLQSLDDVTRHRLQTAGSGINRFDEFVEDPLMQEADVDGLPQLGEANSPMRQGGWIHRLDALSRYTNSTLNMFLKSKGITSIDTADKGGNSDLYKTLYGTARWKLVQQGWFVYEMFKPGEATGTEGGPFHRFLLAVFKFATGLDPEENGKLETWLKKVPPLNRRMQEITERELALIEREAELDSAKMSLAERQRQMKKIADEALALEKESYDLWPLLYPYSYPQEAARK